MGRCVFYPSGVETGGRRSCAIEARRDAWAVPESDRIDRWITLKRQISEVGCSEVAAYKGKTAEDFKKTRQILPKIA